MPEGPVDSKGTRAAPVRVHPAGPEDGPGGMPLFGATIPRVVVRADLLPALSVLSIVTLLGLPIGWAWSRLAPPEQSALTSTGKLAPLLAEGYQQFDALGIFLLLNLAVGVLTGAALWMVRRRRGPVVLIAGVVGSIIAGWLAIQTGDSSAAGLYPPPARPEVGDLIMVPPEVGTLWAVLAQPLALSFIYGMAASWNGLDDLGRRVR